jgi:hypothetical protein
MGEALRTVRLMQLAMLVSIALYVFIGERVAGRVPAPNSMVFYGISFVSISIIGAILVVRRTLVMQSEVQLLQKPDDRIVIARWRMGYVVTYALCEALALFAFVLRFLGFTLAQVWPFYLGGFALMLFFAPRAPREATG